MITQSELQEMIALQQKLDAVKDSLKKRLEAEEAVETMADPTTSLFAHYTSTVTTAINYSEFIKKLTDYAKTRKDTLLSRWIKDTTGSMAEPRISSRRSLWIGIASLRPPTTLKEFEKSNR